MQNKPSKKQSQSFPCAMHIAEKKFKLLILIFMHKGVFKTVLFANDLLLLVSCCLDCLWCVLCHPTVQFLTLNELKILRSASTGSLSSNSLDTPLVWALRNYKLNKYVWKIIGISNTARWQKFELLFFAKKHVHFLFFGEGYAQAPQTPFWMW